ncbi:MAG: GNAT family N-acetyltransferase [Anaerotignum sp.]
MKFHNLFHADGSFTQTEHYLLRPISPEDKSDYQQLAKAETPAFLQNPPSSASALAWEDLLAEEHLTCSIFEKENHGFCGFCQLQWIFSSAPELGIDLLPSFQKQGVAAEVLPAFLAQAGKLLPIDHFYAKVKKNNIPSQRLAEKIGGVCIGMKSLLPGNFPPEMAALAEQEFPDFFFYEYHFPSEKPHQKGYKA